MNDANIRRAVSASIDRALIASSVYGNGSAIKQFLPEGTNGYIGGGYTAQWYEYNPDEAKKLLADSSYDGSTIEVIVDSSLSNSTQLSAALLSMLEEAGMKVNLQFVEAAAMSSIFAKGEYDIVVRSFGHSPDACPFLFTLIVEDFMKTKYDNKEMMDYFRAAGLEIDMDKRAELVQKGAAIANDQCAPVMPLCMIESSLVS
jgi:peptide/nickel transport system substrate-binding protein